LYTVGQNSLVTKNKLKMKSDKTKTKSTSGHYDKYKKVYGERGSNRKNISGAAGECYEMTP